LTSEGFGGATQVKDFLDWAEKEKKEQSGTIMVGKLLKGGDERPRGG